MKKSPILIVLKFFFLCVKKPQQNFQLDNGGKVLQDSMNASGGPLRPFWLLGFFLIYMETCVQCTCVFVGLWGESDPQPLVEWCRSSILAVFRAGLLSIR